MDILKKYFYGLLPSEQEDEVRRWLAENGNSSEVDSTFNELLDEQQVEDRNDSSAAFQKVCRRLGLDEIRKRNRTRSILRWTVSVAACLVFLSIGFFGYRYVVPVEEVVWNELKVPKGETAELLLPDGTMMYLNSGSRITYPSLFRGDSRRVFVEGEIYADVAHDPGHPFVIDCGDVGVRVLGTRFILKAYDDAECVEMLLMEGCVQMDVDVKSHVKQVTMHPGDMLQFDRRSGNMDLRNFNPENYKGFYDNRSIHFFNLTLSDIASDLERLFGTRVVLLDESLARTRYFAWFTNNETLEQILASIDVDGKIKYSNRDGVIYISRR